MTTELQKRVMEYHPELAYKKLAGRVLKSKHTNEGIRQRLRILKKFVPGLTSLIEDKAGRNAKIDDVLDAVIGLHTAHFIAIGPDYHRHLPASKPPRDERCLRMEVWF